MTRPTRDEERAKALIRGSAGDIGLTGCHVAICAPCLDGVGGECHTPGCLFWMSSAPDIPIRERALDANGYEIAHALSAARSEGVAEGVEKAKQAPTVPTHTVADIPDARLIERAIRAAHVDRGRAERWVHVMAAFSLGSTYAQQLCARFELDPFEEVGTEPDDADDEDFCTLTPGETPDGR